MKKTLTFCGSLLFAIGTAVSFLLGWNILAVLSLIVAMGFSTQWTDETENINL